MDKNTLQRLVSGTVYGLLIFFCTTHYGSLLINILGINIEQNYLYFGLIFFFTFMGAWECTKIMKFNSILLRWGVLLTGILLMYHFGNRFFHQHFLFNFNFSDILGLSLILFACITLFRFTHELYYDSGKIIFTIVYTFLPFGFALGLPSTDFSEEHSFGWETFILFILIWNSDSFAYLVGTFFGRNKIAPQISSKKTWEGLAGGILCTLISGYLIELYFPHIKGNWIIIGFLVSIFAPLGDLVESKFKRTFRVKDSGNIIPGHGGVLDRLDSFIICAPVVYLYFMVEKLF